MTQPLKPASIEPIDDDLASALGALRDDDVPVGVEDKLFARLQASTRAASHSTPEPSRPTTHAPTSVPSPGAPWWMVPTAFVLGGALGAFVWQSFAPAPPPTTTVREVLVEVFPDAGTDAFDVRVLDAGPTPSADTAPDTVPTLDPPRGEEFEATPAAARDAERSLLMRAQVALTRSLPGDALTALHEHRRRYPRGQLSEEREALWVQALAASGDPHTQSAAASFLQRYPDSIFREAVEAVR